MSSAIKPSIVKILAMKSGNRCAFPACPNKLAFEGNNLNGFAVIGEIAHIAGEKPDAARYDPSMTGAERNSVHNLMYMCPNHHTEIDKPGNTFSVATLTVWKRDHEGRVDQGVMDALPDVSFTELEMVTTSIVSGTAPIPNDDDFVVIDPAKKMRLNDLTGRSRVLLTMGLAAAPEVTSFIRAMTPVVPEFGNRLKTGFQKQFDALASSGLQGDDLFDELYSFAAKYSSEARVRAASLAVLGYLFQVCDVFKKDDSAHQAHR